MPHLSSFISHPSSLILHIGQGKTGTSSLQKFLADNRETLIRHSILYPDITAHGHPIGAREHNMVADSISGFARYPGLSPREYFEQFFAAAKEHQCESILLSGENFFGGLPQPWDIPKGKTHDEVYIERLKTLKSLIPEGTQIKIIAYLRPQHEWLESSIAHLIRYEGLNKRRIYESDYQIAKLLMPRMDYAHLLELWQEHLSPADMQIMPYSAAKSSIEKDFLNRINLPENAFPDMTPLAENKGLSRELLELKKVLNTHCHNKTEERVRNIILDEMERETGSGEKYQIDPKLKSSVMKHLRDSNQALINTYWADQPEAAEAFLNEDKTDYLPFEQSLAKPMKLFRQKRYALRAHVLYAKLYIQNFLRYKLPGIYAILKSIKN